MFGKRLLLGLAGLFLATATTSASGQVYYPYPCPYPYPYSADLYLWPGSTLEGDIDRGMGVYLMGAGVYNYYTAWAGLINWERWRRECEFIEMSQQIQNRRYVLKRAAQHEMRERNRKKIEDRHRQSPTARDVVCGDALNSAFREITTASEILRDSREAAMPIPSDLVRQIPLRHAPHALTFQLERVSASRLPIAIRRYVAGAEANAFAKYVRRLNTQPTTTLGELLNFMQVFQLQFGVAETPSQRLAFHKLYSRLATVTDRIRDARLRDQAAAGSASPTDESR